MRNRKPRIILVVVLVAAVAVAAGIGVMGAYGSYRMEQLSHMSYLDMLAYMTRDNPDAAITVGIIRNGETSVAVYGEHGVRLATAAIPYEIGSITKTFTASLLCKAIADGKARLDDPIDRYLDLPDGKDYPTIRELATHTSGYKSHYFEQPMIGNFLQGRNSFTGITRQMLIDRLGRIDRPEPASQDAGRPFAYANFGMAALGAVLEQIYQKDYADLIEAYAADELGLGNTRVADGSGSLPYAWDWSGSDAYRSAGALISDIDDMLQYLRLQMAGNPKHLAMAHEPLVEVKTTSATHARMGIRVDAVGIGWMIDREHNLVWHNGGTGHYNSYIGFDRSKRTGVVVLSNLPPDDRIPATVVGVKILTTLDSAARQQEDKGSE